jgi:hypothetical protein
VVFNLWEHSSLWPMNKMAESHNHSIEWIFPFLTAYPFSFIGIYLAYNAVVDHYTRVTERCPIGGGDDGARAFSLSTHCCVSSRCLCLTNPKRLSLQKDIIFSMILNKMTGEEYNGIRRRGKRDSGGGGGGSLSRASLRCLTIVSGFNWK